MGEFLLIIVLIELISVWFTSIQKICVAKWKLIVVDDTHNYGFVDTEKTKIICNSEENTHDFFFASNPYAHRWLLPPTPLMAQPSPTTNSININQKPIIEMIFFSLFCCSWRACFVFASHLVYYIRRATVRKRTLCAVCVPIFPLAFNKNFIITRGILDANTQMPANNNNNRKYYLRAALWERRAAGAPPASPQQRPGPRHTCWMSEKKKYIRWATAATPPTAITT